MDIELEKQMVGLYFAKAYRARILHELGSPSKRDKVLHRLCHSYADILLPQVMVPIVSSDATEIARMILLHGGQRERCYLLSLLDGGNGVFLSLEEALHKAVGNGMAALLYCGSGVAYFEAEQEQGPPPRFLLKHTIGST